MKKSYYVEIPVLMTIKCLVEEVENENEAIEKAMEGFDVENLELKDGYHCDELSPYKKIVQGNYYLGHISEATAKEE